MVDFCHTLATTLQQNQESNVKIINSRCNYLARFPELGDGNRPSISSGLDSAEQLLINKHNLE